MESQIEAKAGAEAGQELAPVNNLTNKTIR